MANEATIMIRVDGAAQAQGAVKGINDAFGQMQNAVKGTNTAIRDSGSLLGSIGRQAAGVASGLLAFKAVTGVFGGLKDSMVGFNSLLQNSSIGFATFMGSVDGANRHLSQLMEFARKTPFDFPELVSASQKMQGFGFAAQDVIPILQAVGDSAAAAGRGSEAVGRITLALGQMAARGKVSMQELNQLSEAGVPGLALLAQGMEKTTAETVKMVEKGLIPADQAIKILVEGMENRAAGAMDKMASTWSGATSNIRDAIQQLTGQAFKPLFDLMTEGAVRLAKFLETKEVRDFARDVATQLSIVAKALQSLFRGDFSQFGAVFSAMAKQVAQAIGNLGVQIVGQIPNMVRSLAGLAGEAVQWGYSLVQAYGAGMVRGIGGALAGAVNTVATYIASFFKGHSPPERGPLSDIDRGAINVMNAYLEGFSKADFSILDEALNAVRDILTTALNLGDIDQIGFYDKLLGGYEVLGEAIAQMREFGNVSDEVFGQLESLLGSSGAAMRPLLDGLFEMARIDEELSALNDEMRELDRQMRELDSAVRVVERQIKDLDRGFRDLSRPLEKEIRDWERFYDAQLSGLDRTIDRLKEQIRLKELAFEPDLRALTLEEAKAKLAVSELRVTEAQNAPSERRARILKDIASLQQDITEAQKDAQDDKTPEQRERSARRIADLQGRMAELQDKLGREGVATEEDRLRVVQAQLQVKREMLSLTKLEDPELQRLNQELQTAQTEQARIEGERADQVDPLKRKLDEVTQEYKDQKAVLQEQLEPLEDQRDLLEDAQRGLEDRRRNLEEERDAIEDSIAPLQERLRVEKDISEALKARADAIEAAAKAAAGGGAGGADGGAGGIGLPNVDIPGLGLGVPDRGPSLSEMDAEDQNFATGFVRSGASLEPPPLEEAKSKWKGAFEDLRAFIVDNAKPIISGIGAALGSVWGTAIVGPIALLIPESRQKIGEWLDTFRDGLGPLADTIGRNFRPAVDKFGQLLEEMVKKLRDDVIPAIAGMIASATVDIAGGVAEWGKAFVEWIAPRIGPMLKELYKLLDDIIEWIATTALPEVVGALAKWGLAFLDWVATDVVPFIGEKLAEFGAHVLGWIDENKEPTKNKLKEFAQKFLDWVKDDVLPYLAGVLGDIMAGIGTWIKESVGKLPGMMADIGKAMISGIRQGIENAWGGFVSYLEEKLRWLPEPLRKVLGISSPSRVFAEQIGLPIAQGIAKGVASGDGMVGSAIGSLIRGAIDMARAEAAQAIGSATSTTARQSNIPGYDMASRGQPFFEETWGDYLDRHMIIAINKALSMAVPAYATNMTATAQSITGMASGGVITEPITGIGASGRRYTFGEGGQLEAVIPRAQLQQFARALATQGYGIPPSLPASVAAVLGPVTDAGGGQSMPGSLNWWQMVFGGPGNLGPGGGDQAPLGQGAYNAWDLYHAGRLNRPRATPDAAYYTPRRGVATGDSPVNVTIFTRERSTARELARVAGRSVNRYMR